MYTKYTFNAEYNRVLDNNYGVRERERERERKRSNEVIILSVVFEIQ